MANSNLEQTGLEFVTEGADSFVSTILDATGALNVFEAAGSVAQSTFDAFGEIVTGALRKVGEIAVEALGQAAGAIKDFFTSSVSEALDAQNNLQKLNSILKSTGGEAGLTAEQAQKLATDMRDLAGGSDDAVLAIEEIGLRAGTVSAEQMPAFIQSTLDLAQVTGDAASAATLLARAPEDIVGAMGKAQRAGIIFSATLRDQIKAMVKSGDTAGALTLFQKRLAEATGGLASDAAKTLSGQWAILQGHFKEVQETIGTALLPVLQQLFDNVLKPALPLLEDWGQSLANLITMIFSGDFKGGIFGQMEDSDFITFIFDARDAIISLWGWINTSLLPVLKSVGSWILNIGIPAIISFATEGWQFLLDTIANVTSWIQTNVMPILQPIFTALGGLWTAFISNDPEAFISALKKLFTALADAANEIWSKYLKPAFDTMVLSIQQWATDQIPVIKATFETWQSAFTDWANEATPPFLNSLGKMVGAGTAWLITEGIPGMVQAIIDVFAYALGLKKVDTIAQGKSFASGFVEGFVTFPGWNSIGDTIFQIFYIVGFNIVNIIGQWISGIESALYQVQVAIKDQWGGFEEAGVTLMDGLRHGIWRGLGWIIDAAVGVAQAAVNAFRDIWQSRSPSKVGIDLGFSLPQGMAIGLDRGSSLIDNAMQQSIIPSMMPSQMFGGSSVSNSQTSNYNLNVDSNQSSQGISSDFSIMRSMAGA